MGLGHGPNIVKDGLVFYVDAANPKSYPRSGTVVDSMIGNTSGSLNGTTYSTDAVGSFNFDGIDDDIKLNSRFAEAGQTDITINIWFKITGDGSSGNNGLINEIASSQPFRSRILLNNSGNIVYYTIASTQRVVNLSSTIPDNTWTNLTLIKDSSVGSKLYINSGYEYGNSSDIGNIAGIQAGVFPGTILGLGAETVYFMNGEISNITVYNRALFTKEITQNYNALKPRFN